jgi:hypothetical protein
MRLLPFLLLGLPALARVKVRTYTAGPGHRRQVETTGGDTPIITIIEDVTVITIVTATVTGDDVPHTTTLTSGIPDTTATTPSTATAGRTGEMTLVEKGTFGMTTLVGYWQLRLGK